MIDRRLRLDAEGRRVVPVEDVRRPCSGFWLVARMSRVTWTARFGRVDAVGRGHRHAQLIGGGDRRDGEHAREQADRECGDERHEPRGRRRDDAATGGGPARALSSGCSLPRIRRWSDQAPMSPAVIVPCPARRRPRYQAAARTTTMTQPPTAGAPRLTSAATSDIGGARPGRGARGRPSSPTRPGRPPRTAPWPPRGRPRASVPHRPMSWTTSVEVARAATAARSRPIVSSSAAASFVAPVNPSGPRTRSGACPARSARPPRRRVAIARPLGEDRLGGRQEPVRVVELPRPHRVAHARAAAATPPPTRRPPHSATGWRAARRAAARSASRATQVRQRSSSDAVACSSSRSSRPRQSGGRFDGLGRGASPPGCAGW